MVAECGCFYSGTPGISHCHRFVGRLGIGLDSWGDCCMDVSASDVYRLTADELKQVCFSRGLDCRGPLRALLQRSEQINSTKMQTPPDEVSNQTGITTDVGDRAGTPVPQPGDALHSGSEGGPMTILVELLKQLSPLRSEEPEAITDLFVRLDEI